MRENDQLYLTVKQYKIVKLKPNYMTVVEENVWITLKSIDYYHSQV